jgi:hypothetical protein
MNFRHAQVRLLFRVFIFLLELLCVMQKIEELNETNWNNIISSFLQKNGLIVYVFFGLFF